MRFSVSVLPAIYRGKKSRVLLPMPFDSIFGEQILPVLWIPYQIPKLVNDSISLFTGKGKPKYDILIASKGWKKAVKERG